MYEIVKLLHLFAGIVWMGGMAFMLLALRPAALAVLDAPQRNRLMGFVWGRFFTMVGISIAVLFFSGMHMYTSIFRATRLATGGGGVPLGWNVMTVLGILMMLLFGHIYGQYRRYKRAHRADDTALAQRAAAQIHRWMLINFILGLLAITAVRLVR